MKEKKILVEKKGKKIGILNINNPKKLNAIDLEMRKEMCFALEALENDTDVKVIVITSKGKNFSVGGDIKEWKEYSVAESINRIKSIHEVIRKIIILEKPIIAMVKGYAIGGGMNIALACDLIYAAEDASFAQSFVKLGMIPDAGGMCFLPIAIGLPKAKALMFTGETISAKKAYDLGIVNEVFAKDEIEKQTFSFASQLADGPPLSMRIIKKILNSTFLSVLEKIFEYETQGQSLCLNSKDHKEGKAAFLEKRKPKFSGE
jgi:2-(1,2-epoxy-1,2-dihydrophenyl)acetyl-CoA isomerase